MVYALAAAALVAAAVVDAQNSTKYPGPADVPVCLHATLRSFICSSAHHLSQYPNSYYPGYENAAASAGAMFGQTSPPKYPSPWVQGAVGGAKWAAAITQAQNMVKQMTLLEKVNLTTGVGWESDRCVGNTGSVPRLGFRSLCLQE